MPVRPLVVAISILAAGPAAQAADIGAMSGTWRTVRHGALVEIRDCGDGSPCGALAWADPEILDGHATDARNPDPGLRSRALLGTPVLWGFAADGGGRWRGGRLYNPDDGKTFRCLLDQTSDTELKVTGCLGPFCRSQTWTRVDVGLSSGGN